MLVLLADIRKKLLWLWLAGAALLGILVFLRTLTGMYEGMVAEAWLWYFAILLPTLVLLYTAVVGNRNPSRVIRRSTFTTLYAGGLCYWLLALATLLGRPDAAQGQSLQDYLRLSYIWLMPFQALLLLLFWLLYFRKEPLFQPDAALMEAYVGKKAEYARRNSSLLQTRALEALQEPDGLDKVFLLLRENLGNANNELLLLQSQHANWKRERDLNLADRSTLQRELNRMTLAAIHLIENLT